MAAFFNELPEYDDDDDFVEFAIEADELLFDGAENAREAVPARTRTLRDRGNPMEAYDDTEFAVRYRFAKTTVVHLLSMLSLAPKPNDRGLPLPPMLQLLVALRFYGAATFQRVAGDLVNVSQSTVCRTVAAVSTSIARDVFPRLVQFPKREDMPAVMHSFYKVAKFPGVTGCIDGTHIRIKSPGGDAAEVYRNRKGVFSINVQVSANLFSQHSTQSL